MWTMMGGMMAFGIIGFLLAVALVGLAVYFGVRLAVRKELERHDSETRKA